MNWIRVEEELPLIGEEVLVYTVTGHVTALARRVSFNSNEPFFWTNDYPGRSNLHLAESVTHWMPLPEPPKDQQP